MAQRGQRVIALAELRRELLGSGDVRSTIKFQNDINALIAAVADLDMVPLGPLLPAPRPVITESRRRLRPVSVDTLFSGTAPLP
jgi:hypothetical protein